MMEERKEEEIKHYDEAAQKTQEESGDFEGFSPLALRSYQFLYGVAVSYIAGKKVLDYGCGNGVHTPLLVKYANEVIGIDLSAKSLELAQKIADQEQAGKKARFITMDCESLEFPEQSFDVVFDGGTFSSLDFERAIGEITRVLKPSGVLIGIETFGHNPIANAKRGVNRIRGKRTSWAASHIVTQREVARLKKLFRKVEVHYFHFLSLFAFPLLGLPGGLFVLRLLENIDKKLLAIPFLKKYAFKIVFICSEPRT